MQFTPSVRRNRLATWLVVLLALAASTTGVYLARRASAKHAASSAQLLVRAAAPVQPAGSTAARSLSSFGPRQLTFEPNLGQTDSRVKFLSRNSGYELFLTSDEAVFKSSVLPEAATGSPRRSMAGKRPARPTSVSVIRMRLRGASPRSVQGVAPSEGRSNYFIGRDPNKWVRNVPQFSRIAYDELYPGVDLTFYGHERTLEFDFIVKPGADPRAIALSFEGAHHVHTNAGGDLVLTSNAGDLYLQKPVAYQREGSLKKPVDAAFVARNHEVRLALGAYDPTRELIIDPTFVYSTYLGGANADYGHAVVVDSTGAAYVTGQTSSTDFPQVGGVQKTNAGNSDVFVAKFTPDGSALVYSTYLGGSGDDSGNAIAIDGSNNVYIAGGTASDGTVAGPVPFPTTANAPQPTYGGGTDDGFVAKIDPTGSQLLYSSFVGGSAEDIVQGMTIDGNGIIYAVGETLSTDLHTVRALQGTNHGLRDGFIVKADPASVGFAFLDYLGGSDTDVLTGIGLDNSGNIYVGGLTTSTDFPLFGTPYQSKCGTDGKCNPNASGAQFDSVFAAIQADLSKYIYSTYFGGSGSDQAQSLAVDPLGNAFIVGGTDSTDLPTMNPFQANLANGAGGNVFVTELNPSGSALKYSTYLGGNGTDLPTAVVLDGANNVYVTGQTTSSNFPIANFVQNVYGGKGDAFVSLLNPSASGSSQLVFSTFLGGSQAEDTQIGGIAIDTHGNIYVTGDTASPNFTTVKPFQKNLASNTAPDAFLTQITASVNPIANFTVALAAFSPDAVTKGASGNATVTLQSINAFKGNVGLNCNITPVTAVPPTCVFKPATVNLPADGTMTSTLTMKTSATSFDPSPVSGMWIPVAGLALFSAGLAGRRRRISWGWLGALLLFTVALGMLGCSSGGGSNSSHGTTSGIYTITVTGNFQGATATSSPQNFGVR